MLFKETKPFSEPYALALFWAAPPHSWYCRGHSPSTHVSAWNMHGLRLAYQDWTQWGHFQCFFLLLLIQKVHRDRLESEQGGCLSYSFFQHLLWYCRRRWQRVNNAGPYGMKLNDIKAGPAASKKLLGAGSIRVIFFLLVYSRTIADRKSVHAVSSRIDRSPLLYPIGWYANGFEGGEWVGEV